MERKKLIDLLPEFVQQFKEFKEIMEAEDEQMDLIDKNVQRILNNAFIADCDEYGIKKYEALLNITPIADDTLESRKSRVLLQWNDALPYTYRTLIKRLDTFCGPGNYEIESDLKNYTLMLKTHLSMPGQVQELEKMIDCIIPFNIVVTTENSLHHDLNGTVFMGGATVQTSHFIIETLNYKAVKK